MTVGIYKITCTANNKIYVGQSIHIEKRFNQHMCKPPKKMREDFALYGKKAFRLDILEECDKSQLNKLEKHYIATLKPEYNCDHVVRKYTSTPETRMKQRLASLNRKHTAEAKKKISIATSKRVRCVETGVVFESITKEVNFAGVSGSTISACLHGRKNTAGGYHWEFENEMRPIPIDKTKKPIYCVETGIKYDSIRDASSALGITPNNISSCLKGKSKTAGGLHFIYEYETEPRSISPDKRYKPVRCVQTGVVFESVAEASKITGVFRHGIYRVLEGKRKTAGGYTWEYI